MLYKTFHFYHSQNKAQFHINYIELDLCLNEQQFIDTNELDSHVHIEQILTSIQLLIF